tara:strand:+ start:163 stop:393 length:231 start_codon:yes stop_codon:yes gene_type:complete
MSPNEFKQWKKQEFNDALQKRCDETGVSLEIISGASVMMYQCDPNSTTIYIVGNDVCALHNDGNKVSYDFIGNIRG